MCSRPVAVGPPRSTSASRLRDWHGYSGWDTSRGPRTSLSSVGRGNNSRRSDRAAPPISRSRPRSDPWPWLGGLLALALVQPWGSTVPRRLLRLATWVGAAVALPAAAYGVVGIVLQALAAAGHYALKRASPVPVTCSPPRADQRRIRPPVGVVTVVLLATLRTLTGAMPDGRRRALQGPRAATPPPGRCGRPPGPPTFS